MQQMNSFDEEGRPSSHEEYSRYEGVGPQLGGGQKIRGDDDELFASMLVRKMKSEMGNEKSTFSSQRMILGIVSICAVVVLFGFLVLALVLGAAKNGGASIALGWGFIATCGVIIGVNGYFSRINAPAEKPITQSQKRKAERTTTKEVEQEA